MNTKTQNEPIDTQRCAEVTQRPRMNPTTETNDAACYVRDCTMGSLAPWRCSGDAFFNSRALYIFRGVGLNFAGTGCPWVHTRSFSSLAPTLGIVVSSGGVGFTSAGPVGL